MYQGKKNREGNSGRLDMGPDAPDKVLGTYRVPAGKAKEQAWNTIFESIEIVEPVRVVPLRGLFLRVAASIIIAVGIAAYALLYSFGNVDITVLKGSQLVHFLPDSSQVILNADSRLTYNKNRWFAQRRVLLKGEGLFKVKRGSWFQVRTPTATASVMGTIFNVYARKGLTRVSCIEGKVKVVALESKKTVVLTQGLETKTMGYAMEKAIVKGNNQKEVPWIKGDFYFNNTPINAVIEELERQFDVDVFIDGDTNRFYTGYFSNKSLNDALQLVCIPMNLSWKTNGNMIIINESSK
ncbi:MAG: FecR family protein [Bacteroidales bacterium]